MKRFIDPDRLEETLKGLGRDIVVTHGEYRFPAHCEARDLDWNHMDQAHRPWIHRTYEQSTRIYTDGNVALSLTRMPMGPFKFSILLTDVRIRPGLFYQTYNLFSLLYIHGLLRNSNEQMVYEWYIASPWYLKPLHFLLSRKIWKLNHVQIAEDVPVRLRRADLRKKGYHFSVSEEDFFNSNTSTPNTVYPQLSAPVSFDLSKLELGASELFTEGSLELFVRKDGAHDYRVWNGVCPHEGGPLSLGRFCGKNAEEIECPWHGLKFAGAALSLNTKSARLGPLTLALSGARLTVSRT